MRFWTPHSIARVVGGDWLNAPHEGEDVTPTITGASTDSRAIAPGQLFIPLKGDKFDGHDFIGDTIRAGAGMLIVSNHALGKVAASLPDAPPILLVPDTLAALQRLAIGYRDRLGMLGCKVIAIAGSNGKTTTRNLVHAVLSEKLRGVQSPKSFNNHIGVPLTLLSADCGEWPIDTKARTAKGPSDAAETKKASAISDASSLPPRPISFVVVEIGTNHPGEIHALGKIVRPDAAVITSLGYEHMEHFKTLDGVAREEAAILRHIRPGGIAIIEGGAMTHFERLGFPEHGMTPPDVGTIVYGAHPEAIVAFYDEPVWDGTAQVFTTRGGRTSIRLPLLGKHNAVNALAAVAIGRWVGMDDTLIARALSEAKSVEMRLNVVRIGSPAAVAKPPGEAPAGVTLINDAYNANPTSVAAALYSLRQFPLPLTPGDSPTKDRTGTPRSTGQTAAPAKDLVFESSGPATEIGRRVVILGDMFELGEEAPELHRQIGRLIADLSNPVPGIAPPGQATQRFHQAILVGKLAMFMAEALAKLWPQDRVHAFPTWDDGVPDKVASLLRDGDVILLKASRGMKLERLVPAIQRRFET